MYKTEKVRIAPVIECVGWTVLNGKESTENGTILDASGDTIVNAKVGVRFGFGEIREPGALSPVDFYIGYGRALTGEVWYKDIIRLEMRGNFWARPRPPRAASGGAGDGGRSSVRIRDCASCPPTVYARC